MQYNTAGLIYGGKRKYCHKKANNNDSNKKKRLMSKHHLNLMQLLLSLDLELGILAPGHSYWLGFLYPLLTLCSEADCTTECGSARRFPLFFPHSCQTHAQCVIFILIYFVLLLYTKVKYEHWLW